MNGSSPIHCINWVNTGLNDSAASTSSCRIVVRAVQKALRMGEKVGLINLENSPPTGPVAERRHTAPISIVSITSSGNRRSRSQQVASKSVTMYRIASRKNGSPSDASAATGLVELWHKHSLFVAKSERMSR